MKNLVFLASMFISVLTFAQNQELNEIKVTAPQFQTEVFKSVNDLLTNNVEYPAEAKNANLQGTEVVQFTVTPEGKIKDYNVINSVSSDFNNEVIRILEVTNGKWTAGTSNGNSVEMKIEISISFFLHSETDMVKTAKNYQQKGNNWMFQKNNPTKALKYYNRAIVLLPNEESLLAMRGLCNYKLGNDKEATKDWGRIKLLAKKNGNTNVFANLPELSQNTDGYVQMMETLKK